MANLAALRAQLPDVADMKVQADGFCLWLISSGEMNSVVLQTLGDYGGVSVAEETGQALWFFFTPDVFLAAARLAVWARFNQLPLTMQIFPARFKVGRSGGKTLIFDESLWQQNADVAGEFQVWAHTGVSPVVAGIPGLSLSSKTAPSGMADGSKARWLAESRASISTAITADPSTAPICRIAL